MKIEVNLTEIRIRPDLARPAIVALLAALPRDEAELALLEWSTLQNLHEHLRQEGAGVPMWVGPLAAGRTLAPAPAEPGAAAAPAPADPSPVATPEPAEPEPIVAPEPPQPASAAAPEPAPVPAPEPPSVKPVPPPAPPPFRQPVPPSAPPQAASDSAAGATTVPITVPPPTAQPAKPIAAAVPPPTAVVAAPDPVANGTADEPEETRSLPLRDLCRYVEDRAGRQMLMHVLKGTYGANNLKELGDKADAFRGDLIKLLVPY